MFNKIEIDPRNLTNREIEHLENISRKILIYTSKKLKSVEKSQRKYNTPLISDIIIDLRLNINDIKKAYAYMNSNNFLISPAEDAHISKKAKIIINLIKKNEEIPTIYDLISKGLKIHEIKKALVQLESLLRNQFSIIDLQIPQIKYPVDNMMSDYKEFVDEDLQITDIKSVQVQEPMKENGELLPLEVQIDNSKFERSNEEPVKFIGSPDDLLKTIKAHIEHEAAFSKITEI